jgi:hypothetical protein
MTSITTKPDSSQPAAEAAVDLFDNWFDPIETGMRGRVRDAFRSSCADARGALDNPRSWAAASVASEPKIPQRVKY